jgi:small-conductance mechanosensitive channel
MSILRPTQARRRVGLYALIALMIATVAGWLWTREPAGGPATATTAPGTAAAAPLVDQSPLKTAQMLSAFAATPDERRLAQEALRAADHEVDLAFAEALRRAAQSATVPDARTRDIQARADRAQQRLKDDEARVARLDAQAGKAAGTRKQALDGELELARAQVELDQDALDDAAQDLIRAGGDPQARIRLLVQEHEAASHGESGHSASPGPASAGSAPPAPGPAVPEPAAGSLVGERGLVGLCRQGLALGRGLAALRQAGRDAEAEAVRLSTIHESLEAQAETRAAASPDPARGAADTSPAGPAGAAGASPSNAAALVSTTKRLASDRRSLADFDKRIGDQKELASIYARWSAAVASRQRAVTHSALLGVLVILSIGLVGLFFDTWLERVVRKVALERRRVEQLRTLARVAVRVVGVVLVLLVVAGPPGQVATFLGLAGAGLTVALKDFIVGFIGWFVLMGKNGIRLGDWVEINGVSGEVVELGPLHTVLLETGNWAETGHPTGRRVTLVNSFAIEGHYFNFSTSGQWLWDELQVHLPPEQDAYPMVEAISTIVSKETQGDVRLAEEEWQRVAQSKELKGFSAGPAVSIRPARNGIDVVVRYMTRANERHQVRSRVYQAVSELLGHRGIPPSPPSPPPLGAPRAARDAS